MGDRKDNVYLDGSNAKKSDNNTDLEYGYTRYEISGEYDGATKTIYIDIDKDINISGL